MAVTAKLTTEPRWSRTFRGPDTFTDDLGSTGAWVGPRTGPDKRTHDEEEDYVIRRLLVAWKETGLALETFPENCPFEVEQVLDLDFFPGKDS